MITDADKALAQVKQLVNEGSVISINGHKLVFEADTICIHGDNESAVAIAKAIHRLLKTTEVL